MQNRTEDIEELCEHTGGHRNGNHIEEGNIPPSCQQRLILLALGRKI